MGRASRDDLRRQFARMERRWRQSKRVRQRFSIPHDQPKHRTRLVHGDRDGSPCQGLDRQRQHALAQLLMEQRLGTLQREPS